MPKVWVVRADGGTQTQNCVDGGFTGIGWCEHLDGASLTGFESIRAAYASTHPHILSNSVLGNHAGELARFAYDLQVGDYVVTPTDNSKWLQYGQITGEYEHVSPESLGVCPYRHRRTVQWTNHFLDRTEFSIPFQLTFRSPVTVFDAKHHAEFLELIGLKEDAQAIRESESQVAEPHDIVIDALLQLSPEDFELLVIELLSAIGFEVEGTQPTNDKGVDFRGTLYVSSVAHIAIVGQVKRYEQKRKISDKPILDLRGRIPSGSRGLFVTTSEFRTDARKASDESGFPEIGLVNGSQFVELLIEYWAVIQDGFKSQLGLRLGLVPQ